MNAELEKQLHDKYPTLFCNKDKSEQESCMYWGIECGDGWYELLSSVCWRISQHEKNIAYPDYIPVKFDQIKEKFGGIRIYYTGGDDYIRGVVSLADEMSYKICEVCGQKGNPNKGGWISTLCETCRNK